MAIILLGPPGAGKGTQARRMSEFLKCPHVSTGDILREALRNETELGKKAKAFMEFGSLVPDDLVNAFVAERLGRKDCRRGFILDGYPRTIFQAEFLQSLCARDNTSVLTLGIEVRDAVLIKRLSSRWMCPRCGRIFNTSLDSSGTGGRCNACDAALVQRKDDAPEVVSERLQVYHAATKPLVRYYQELGTYVAIDGDRPVNEVYDAVLGAVKSRTDKNYAQRGRN